MEDLCPFPDAALVKTIRKQHSQAQFIELSNRIEFSREECSKLDPEFLRYVIYHEIGHWFRWNHIPQHKIDGSRLPGENFLILDCDEPEEGFADGFAAFFIERHTLNRKHPFHDILLDKMLSDHEERIRDSCEDIFRWLSHQLELGEHYL